MGSVPAHSAAVSCGLVHRRGSGPELLWLWYRPAAAAPIQLLARELPYAKGGALKSKKKQKQKKIWSSSHGAVEMSLTSIHEDADSIPDLAQWLRIWRCCELWYRSQTQLGFGVAVAVT